MQVKKYVSGIVNKDIEEEIYAYEKESNISENTIDLRKYLYNAINEEKYSLFRTFDFIFYRELY